MSRDIIDSEAVLEALKGIRAARSLASSPLLALDAVTMWLRSEGYRDSLESRAWALSELLLEIVWHELCLLRGVASSAVDPHSLEPEDAGRRLLEDFRDDNLLRAAWGILFTRYFGNERVTVARLAHRLSVVRRTVERRTTLGVKELTARLRLLEMEARTQVERMPGADPADRIQVHVEPEATNSTLPARLSAVLDTVRDDARVLRLGAEEARALARSRVVDLETYHLTRVIEWSQPRHRLDQRFVELSLLVDLGQEGAGGRWQVETRRFGRLREVMEAAGAPAMVLLGAPGSGKSTLLRRLELDLACAALRGEHDRIPYFVQLNHYRALSTDQLVPPGEWLSQRWAMRYPELPSLDEALASGRVTLLLDALNEMPHADAAVYHRMVLAWKTYLHDVIGRHPDNRIVFSCRSLDYSAPLSTPSLRVPQVRIENLSDAQARRFLDLYAPARAERIWRELADSAQLDLLRSPYFLMLLIGYVESEDRIPLGRAGLFTGFVRQALRRELERDNLLFAPDGLLTERDHRRMTQSDLRHSAFELPEDGVLFRRLSELAFEMQLSAGEGRAAQVRVDRHTALALLDHTAAERIVSAGLALAVLDEPMSGSSLTFFHQLLQEYFAARTMTRRSSPELVNAPWRASAVSPTVLELLSTLPPAEPLPSLPSTGWEETALMAAAMAPQPEVFVQDVARSNLPLAGRCAIQPEVAEQLGDSIRGELRAALVARSRDARADLRARVAAARALGRLGDPRFALHRSVDDSFLEPPMVTIPGGAYPMGPSAADGGGGAAKHAHVASFQIGVFPVTNGEWAHFIRSGAYEDERWWDTPGARAWQRGEGTAEGSREGFRKWRRRLQEQPAILDEKRRQGLLPQQHYDDWVTRLRMSEEEFEAHLARYWPAGLKRAPEYWSDRSINHPAQPVVGISWFEARAYCRWLSVLSGRSYQLPSELQWEAAARGLDGRRFAFGDAFDPEACNTAAAHLLGPSPIGVFVMGDTPEGATDMTGNVHEWTALGQASPIDSTASAESIGRSEDEDAQLERPLRGGAWPEAADNVETWRRSLKLPAARSKDAGMRLAASDLT